MSMKEALMQDEEIHQRIDSLVEEEHRLYGKTGAGGLDDAEHARLQEVERSLDQCWDLLRQRRARREFSLDEGDTAARPEPVVENYEQ